MVTNIKSPRSGKSVANQFVVKSNACTFFQSYNSVIAKVDRKGITLASAWDYSNTTRKYLYQFLKEYGYGGLSRKKVQQLIDEKVFKFKNVIKM